MILEDERTKEQKKTHPFIIIGTDNFLSGWGRAKGGKSYAGWACREEDRKDVFKWVEGRSEMKRVREVYGDYRPSGCVHCHIYVVNDNHPAIKRYYK